MLPYALGISVIAAAVLFVVQPSLLGAAFFFSLLALFCAVKTILVMDRISDLQEEIMQKQHNLLLDILNKVGDK